MDVALSLLYALAAVATVAGFVMVLMKKIKRKKRGSAKGEPARPVMIKIQGNVSGLTAHRNTAIGADFMHVEGSLTDADIADNTQIG